VLSDDLLLSYPPLINSIAALSDSSLSTAQALSEKLQLPVYEPSKNQAQLWVAPEGVSLNMPELGKPFFIDFTAGKYDHRRQFGGGRGQPLAKAIGLKQGQTPTVIDTTAGFARDSFVLASLGCQVMMIEQNPIMAVLIEDAIARALDHPDNNDIVKRLSLIAANSVDYLSQHSIDAEVIYLDPMYPSRDKSALVKKEMQLLHQLVGIDENGAALLDIARQKAKKRVVVKRPKGADFLGGMPTSSQVSSKNTRYDIYPCA
jgi:16S rRNA (guanine1516-N2)-methyltransferase